MDRDVGSDRALSADKQEGRLFLPPALNFAALSYGWCVLVEIEIELPNRGLNLSDFNNFEAPPG